MFKPSALVLTSGLVLIGVSQLLSTWGAQLAVDAALRGDSSTNPATLLGVVLGLAGLMCAVVGVYRLANNVDDVAFHLDRPAREQSAAEIRARIEEIRGQQQ